MIPLSLSLYQVRGVGWSPHTPRASVLLRFLAGACFLAGVRLPRLGSTLKGRGKKKSPPADFSEQATKQQQSITKLRQGPRYQLKHSRAGWRGKNMQVSSPASFEQESGLSWLERVNWALHRFP